MTKTIAKTKQTAGKVRAATIKETRPYAHCGQRKERALYTRIPHARSCIPLVTTSRPPSHENKSAKRCPVGRSAHQSDDDCFAYAGHRPASGRFKSSLPEGGRPNSMCRRVWAYFQYLCRILFPIHNLLFVRDPVVVVVAEVVVVAVVVSSRRRIVVLPVGLYQHVV